MRAKFINEIKQNNSISGLGSIGIGKEGIKRQIKEWLYKYNIYEFTLNEDLSIDTIDSVDISGNKIGEFPSYIQFNEVGGDFDCSECALTSLRGCPRIVKTFTCQWNLITSLIGGPSTVSLDYYCNRNSLLTSLKGAPEILNHSFFCQFCSLTSLIGGPKIVKNRYFCQGNHLKSLKGIPDEIFNLDCSYNEIRNLNDGPISISHCINIQQNPISETKKEIEEKYGVYFVDSYYLKNPPRN